MSQLTFCNSPSSLGAALAEDPDPSLAARVPLKPSWEFPSKTPSLHSSPRPHKGMCEHLDPLYVCKALGCRHPHREIIIPCVCLSGGEVVND